MVRLGVMGVGRVGGEVAYLAASLGIVDDLVLYDCATPLLRAQVLDLQHTGLPTEISTNKMEFRDADICVFVAGMPRNPSVKTRVDLIQSNLPVAQECGSILEGFSGILITVTNPVDFNNYYLHKKTGLPREHCIGFGGQLDSARFALALRERQITGFPFVVGEHGEHQVPLFSTLSQPVPYPVRDAILAELRGASMEVIRGKGGTVFGPALHIIHLIRAVAEDNRDLVSCSSVLEGEYGASGCSLGIPARIGRNGILGIEEWDLDEWEQEKMDGAAQFIGDLCRRIDP
jgi:malate dehydrogenase